VWYILTDVSEELPATIIRVICTVIFMTVITLMMVAVSSYEMTVNRPIYQITRCYIPQERHFILVAIKT
jgi:hypothetical protein